MMPFTYYVLICLYLLLPTAPAAAQSQAAPSAEPLTFAEHIAPLIYTHCTRCHRSGEVAPFPLVSYQDVASRAQTIAAVTGSRYMPPWKPDARYRHYLDENTLSDAEIGRIKEWVAAGAPSGDAARTPPVPEFPAGSQLGAPDMVVSMPAEFSIPGTNRDLYRVFVLPVLLPADRDIAAIEFRAGNKRLVHHAIIGLDTTRQAEALDAAEPGPGYTNFGGFGFEPTEANWAGWVPGQQTRFFPAGMGKKLYKKARLLVQIHYGPTAVAQTDLSSINLFFARQPVRRYVTTAPIIAPQTLTNGPFLIPAGQVKKFHASVRVPFDVTVLSVLPHMHLLGKSWKIWAVKPSGDTIRMVKINDWDFRWQGTYSFLSPQKVPAGSRLEADVSYDNTAANWRNPNSPPQPVRWGESTTAEMLLAYFNVVPYQAGDENIALLATQPAGPAAAPAAGLRLFPNPAGASTTISFALPRASSATLRLLDGTGRLVRTLSEAQRRPAGAQQLVVPLAGLAAGEYLVQLETPEFSQAQRLLVK